MINPRTSSALKKSRLATETKFEFEIASVTFEKHQMKSIFKRMLGILLFEKIDEVEITFGFAWGNEVYESEWLPIKTSSSRIEEMVEAQSQKGIGSIGSDDFLIDIHDKAIRILFCHECDIHIEYSSESGLLENLKSVIRPEEWAWGKSKGQAEWEKLIP